MNASLLLVVNAYKLKFMNSAFDLTGRQIMKTSYIAVCCDKKRNIKELRFARSQNGDTLIMCSKYAGCNKKKK